MICTLVFPFMLLLGSVDVASGSYSASEIRPDANGLTNEVHVTKMTNLVAFDGGGKPVHLGIAKQ